MKKNTAGAAIIALGLLLPAAAQAEDWTGFYVAGQGGMVRLSDRADGGGGTYHSTDGWVGSAAVGYVFPFHVRAELEGTISGGHQLDASKFTAGMTGKVRLSDVRGMFNLYYDIPTGTAFKPYIGAGVGLMRVKFNANEYIGSSVVTGDDTDLAPAWQFAGGTAYNLIDKVDLTLDYRYVDTQKISAKVAVNGVPAGKVSGTLYNSEFRAGVRWGF